MAKYVKASDSIIEVVNDQGKKLKVTERAYNIVYKSKGFKPVNEVSNAAKEANVENTNEVDYFALSAEELQEIKNDDLKAFLDKEGINYKSNDTKDDLIKLITGE
ncbi:hypothetical protein [Cytobacillus firmus]|uniref:hypothetical protein n=1 Tax=Cytobacillus firmus TaxID=1399 RepID=UPI0018CDD6EA|nr:hypothetical protein [Cytobacillus firmus]MBG9549762.1 hypothetical protein [Cytobacillus firmus]MBG9603116.1 hypothetical protein [Cytobacillus firmus]MED1942093.1 hypothetical protein [Cytobacillus firmus]